MQNKRISVCMTSYNGSPYIGQQIESILCQLKENDELIISDDGSTDNTLDIISSFNDNRIKLYLNSFHNHILNFEFCLSKAEGDFIFLSDQDDVWMENKIKVMLHYLQNNDLVCSNFIAVDTSLTPLNLASESTDRKSGFIRNLIHNQFLGCCLAFNRKVLKASLPFPDKLITHDTWIGLIAERVGKTKFIDEELILFRRHLTNTSNTLKGSTLSFSQKISYRYIILKGIYNNTIKRR